MPRKDLHIGADRITWPAVLKPDQGGSGARIQVVESYRGSGRDFPARPVDLAARQPVPVAGVPAARYDVNANSNLRPAVAQAWGFDPFERVVDYLVAQLR